MDPGVSEVLAEERQELRIAQGHPGLKPEDSARPIYATMQNCEQAAGKLAAAGHGRS